MEEAFMDHRMLRRLVLEQKLVDYVYANPGSYGRRYFECGVEFGAAHLWWISEQHCSVSVDWITVEECPVDLDKLPKEDS